MRAKANWQFWSLLVLMSLVTGLGGIFLHHLLEWVENLAFGHNDGDKVFFVAGTSSLHRGVVLLLASLIMAISWYLLQKRRKIAGIKSQMLDQESFPSLSSSLSQLWHILLQIISVGMGSPIGKEGAPREFGALVAARLSRCFSLDKEDHLLLVACGAGAGLSAVYQVPLASSFFVYETLGLKLRVKTIVAVLLATEIGNGVSHLAFDTRPLYQLGDITQLLSWQSLLIVVVLPLVVAPLAFGFKRLVGLASQHRIKDKRLYLSLPATFLLLALVSSFFPDILGNGQMMAQRIMNGASFWEMVWLFLFKFILVILTLWAGAYGGVLTPSFAFGTALGAIILDLFGGVASGMLPLAMLVGAGSFLSVSLGAPLAATGLVIGFTAQDMTLILPVLVASLIAHVFVKQFMKK